MKKKSINIEKAQNNIVNQGILPLYFHKEAYISLEILRAVYSAGIKAVEYTNRGDAAFTNFKAMVALRDESMPDLMLGIGTIKNLTQAKMYREVGADFIVSPGLIPEVAGYCVENDIFHTPGCMTPSEIIAAENAGIGFIKLFPGNLLGPEFLSSIRDIFPKLMFMPTGGVDVTHESIKSWFDAGVSAVGMGSKLITKTLMDNKDYSTIEEEIKKVLDIIKSIQKA
ncbi:MAG: bifunctional 4-hydroxy-2-oxoglutarate aldolase/2-dehydro-3-deoxy-phosphogluconate aldolase [Saprospiraceae bacterium]|nr:bifunctional 4-hydroxy-2-oxoglutarate aldolase/2-dehydro-3-deoxy-phosphogluconate aldolase [Saprospiraceae bacterium]